MSATPNDHFGHDAPSTQRRRRHPRPAGPLTRDELDRGLRLSDVPPVLTAKEAARLMRLSESALYRRVARGEFRTAINGRGKPLRFWRDRFVKEFFGPANHAAAGLRIERQGGDGSGGDASGGGNAG